MSWLARVISAKPEPEAYEITADRLGVRLEECVMIDDRLELCEGAQAVGMKAIMYKGLKQLKTDLESLLAAVTDD
jgi:HAD superfamily hydrolase (TIGR01509 family)